MVKNFYSGTSNLMLPVKNKTQYPPEYREKSRLEYYASLFNSIEINSSFYKIPQGRTVERWAGSVPAGFRFTFKLFRHVTHSKDYRVDRQTVTRFMSAVKNAGDRKGCLLVQFPPSVAIRNHWLFELVSEIRACESGDQWNIAVEFRNKSWYADETYALLNDFGAGMVYHDLPASAAPMEELDAAFAYLRFHGPEGGYRGSYSTDVLAEYASYTAEWTAGGRDVYAYFNNTMGNAVLNLMDFNSLVRGDE
jgi:uncharacterized protein YecE (DUF72 family)